MSFIRAATLARAAVRSLAIHYFPALIQTLQGRLYSTEAPAAKKSGAARYLVPASGLLAGWALYEYCFKGEAEQVKPNKVLTSPLDPQNFVDIKLKRVEPYNHNTSK